MFRFSLSGARGLISALTISVLSASTAAHAEGFTSPDILVLGDSQISFGAGPAFVEFFTDIKAHCSPDPVQKQQLTSLGEMKVSVIGVRSTSLHSWTARSGRAKGRVCDVDPKWKVNAGSYGYVNQTANQYVQIGRGKNYQFCAAGKSPFEEMFREDYYNPGLLLMSFLGNSAKRWANDPELAVKDVEAMHAHLPADIPCIFMTTAPTYKKSITDIRRKAQQNLEAAFEKTGSHCSFVPGVTPQTVAANQGNKKYFRLNKRGMVKDPYHPNKAAAKNFFALEMGGICNAIFDQIGMRQPPVN
jgi:hypothetical protein